VDELMRIEGLVVGDVNEELLTDLQKSTCVYIEQHSLSY